MCYLFLMFLLFTFSCDSNTASPQCGGVVDCSGECNGDSLEDECGECNGPGIIQGACDCDGNVLDECGVCNGGGISGNICDCDGNILDDCGVCDGDLFFTENAGFSATFSSNSAFIRDCSDGAGLGYITTNFNCSLGNYNDWGSCVCTQLFPNECSNNQCSIEKVCDYNGNSIGDYDGNCCDNGFNWDDYQCSIDFVQGNICDCNNNTFDVCGVCGGNGTTCIGCTDDTACNYNSNVYIDDNSCLYTDDICETCENGLIIDNDTDDDTVCDDDEVDGCTDSNACNYNILATDDDGTCFSPNECVLCDACELNDGEVRLNDDGSMWFSFSNSVYGLQFDIEGQNGTANLVLDINDDILPSDAIVEFQNNGSRVRVIIVSFSGVSLFQNNCGSLLQIDSNDGVSDYVLSDVLVSGFNGSEINVSVLGCD